VNPLPTMVTENVVPVFSVAVAGRTEMVLANANPGMTRRPRGLSQLFFKVNIYPPY
jgi:hypothetical protein